MVGERDSDCKFGNELERLERERDSDWKMFNALEKLETERGFTMLL